MNNIKDQLSWAEFELQSNKASRPIKKISEFNRLIAHSDNFFLISGYGAFTDGYILIISKDFIPSYGLVEKNKIKVKFNRNLTLGQVNQAKYSTGPDRDYYLDSMHAENESVVTKGYSKKLERHRRHYSE